MRLRIAAFVRTFGLVSVFVPSLCLFLAGCEGETKPKEVPQTAQTVDANKNMEEFMKNQGKATPKK